jgi:RNA polymerase sigma-70 factor, ECF subfamily
MLTLVDSAALDIAVFNPEYEHVDMSALMHCLGKLDSRSRGVVLQSFQAENSAEEIASSIETSPGNVRIIRHRALLQLRRCLDAGEGART